MREYELIKAHYKDRVAKRSGLPLMNHIDEGLKILDKLGASDNAKRAFCLHPIIQEAKYKLLKTIELAASGDAALLAYEYAVTANAYLPKHTQDLEDELPLIPNLDVKHMLIADKVQNYKDFYAVYTPQKHLLHRHSYQTLLVYFANWFNHLHITEELYDDLTSY